MTVFSIRIRCLGWAALAAALGSSSVDAADELRYQGKPGQQFAYEITIKVDLPDKVTTLRGITRYTVQGATAEQIQLTYHGGLTESSQAKANAGGGRGAPFGDPFRGPPIPGGPFSRPAFAGKVQTTNQLTLSPRGGVLGMKGDSQLPYLLGNVSLLPFEILPPGNENSWKYDSGVSIEQDQSSGRPPFGRFGPFAPADQKEVQAGSETADYSIQSRNDQQIVVSKTYRLFSPAVQDEPAFELAGTGTWTWNGTDHWPQASEMNLKLVITKDNTQVTVPITISYRRASAETLAKIEQEAQQRLKAHQDKMAEDKRRAEAPLTPEEKQSALAAFGSSDVKQIEPTLKVLAGKAPKEPDAEIVAALQTLLTHPSRTVQEQAGNALARWSPEFAQKKKLNEAYTSHMPVPSTDREVNSTTPLYVGQIIQFQTHGPFWHAGEIEDLQPDGKVTVRDRGFTKRVHTVARRNIQLAPDEVDQPKRPAGAVTASTSVAATTATRTWLDATGEHRIEAAYLGFANNKVKMKRADGKEIEVPLEKLSKADQKFVQEQQTVKKSANPFE